MSRIHLEFGASWEGAISYSFNNSKIKLGRENLRPHDKEAMWKQPSSILSTSRVQQMCASKGGNSKARPWIVPNSLTTKNVAYSFKEILSINHFASSQMAPKLAMDKRTTRRREENRETYKNIWKRIRSKNEEEKKEQKWRKKDNGSLSTIFIMKRVRMIEIITTSLEMPCDSMV